MQRQTNHVVGISVVGIQWISNRYVVHVQKVVLAVGSGTSSGKACRLTIQRRQLWQGLRHRRLCF